MPYAVLFAVALVVASTLFLALMTVRTVRTVKDSVRRMAEAGERMAAASGALEELRLDSEGRMSRGGSE